MNRSPSGSLLDEKGLSRFVMPLTGRNFVVALGAALPVWIALGLGLGGPPYRPVGLVAWLAGALAGHLRERFDSVWPAVVMHAA